MKNKQSEELEQNELPAQEEKQEEKQEETCPSIFDKPDPNRFGDANKPVKNRNRHRSNVIIALVLCVAIAGSSWGIWAGITGKLNPFSALMDYINQEESSETTSSQESEQLLIHDYSSYGTNNDNTDTLHLGGVKKVTVVTEKDTYEITGEMGKTINVDPNTMEETEVDTLKWAVSKVEGQNIENVKFSTTTSGFVVTDLLRIPYNSVYAENGNDQIPQGDMTYYEECGIANSKNRLTAEFNNGSKITVIVGNKAPAGDFYFLALENDDAGKSDVPGAPKKDNRIYKVGSDAVAYYTKDPIYFVDKDIVLPVEQADAVYDEETGESTEDPYFLSGELSRFDALSISGSGYAKPYIFQMVDQDKPGYDSIYLMTSPIVQNVDLDAISTLLSPMADGLTAGECLVMQPTNAQLKEYGLLSPTAQVRYVIKGKETVLKIGKQVNEDTDSYAIMVQGNASIFKIAKSVISFISYSQADFASNTLYSCDITLLKTLRVQSQGKDELYRLSHGTDASGEATLTVTTRDGKIIDTDNFRAMYVNLLSLTSFTNVNDGKDAASPYVTISITYNDFTQTDVIRLSPYTDRRYYMSLNGMGSTVVVSNSVDAFVESFKALW